MKLTRLIAIGVLMGTVAAGSAIAQSSAGSQPAEFPPSSFKGKQYVDSKGCVFIRAGIDGTVSWIPRVTRKRSGVCGFKPTFAGQVTEAKPVRVAQAPKRITNVEPAPVPAAAIKRRAAPKVIRQTAPRRVYKPAPAPVIIAQAPAPVIQTAPQTASSACGNLSPMAQRYTSSQGRLAVRCGPQAATIGSFAGGTISGGSQIVATQGTQTGTVPLRRASARSHVIANTSSVTPRRLRLSPEDGVAVGGQAISVGDHRRIVPRHVAINRVNTQNVTVPHGYRPVWDDGRLNKHRGEQDLEGHRSMQLIWTSTVPRRLLNQADGRDITASTALVYPYTNFERQQRELGQVTLVQRNGQTFKRLVRNTTNSLTPQPRSAVARKPVYSSRSAPAPKATASVRKQPARQAQRGEVAGKGFVQVGQFTDTNAAHRMAKKVQRMGLPVRVGRYTKNGRTTRLVIAGPFNGNSATSKAVSRLKRAGFSGAFARR